MIRRFLRALLKNATASAGTGAAARVDPILLRAMDVRPLEEVEIVVADRRFTTFVEEGAAGELRVPHLRDGDVVSILSWGLLHDGQTLAHRAKLVTVDARNEIVSLTES